jgi:uncharacterized protein (TIGR02265 family)
VDSAAVSEKLVYESVLDGLLNRTVGARMTPELKTRLKSIGVDLDQKLKPAYPPEVFQAAVDACCELLFPGVPMREAQTQLGGQMVDGYGATLFGKALMQMTRLLGPKRTLERLPQSLRGGNNFSEAKLTLKAMRDYEMVMSEGGTFPEFTAGSIAALLKVSGAKNPRVIIERPAPPAVTFKISWSE